MKKSSSIIQGALFLGFGAFVAKLLGAIYRVPLTNILGGYGLGLYQMVFPVYSLLLDFSGAGVPSAISRLISKSDNKFNSANQYLISSLKIFIIFGLIASLIMASFSSVFSSLQGDNNAKWAYLFLSPAIFFVSLISCFRGYFQGFMDMRKTATSQIIEQSIKLILGLIFVKIFADNIPFAVAGATFAISISEVIAFLFLYFSFKRQKNKLALNFIYDKNKFKSDKSLIIKSTIPITLIGIMIPLSQIFDSFLAINIVGKYNHNATALYGILSGAVMTIIHLPVSMCYGLASVAIPAISGGKNNKEKSKNAKRILILNLIFSIPCSIFLFIFSEFTINLLFKNLIKFERITAIRLLKLLSPCVIFLSLVQASNAILIGKDKLYFPILSMSMGIIAKTVINIILLNNQSLNIYGGAIGIIACYFLVCLINLIMINKKGKTNESAFIKYCKYQHQE